MTLLTLTVIVAAFIIFKLDRLDRIHFWKVCVPILSGTLALSAILMASVTGDIEAEKQIRNQLTEHYNLQEDVFYKNIQLTSTERLQEVGSSSAIKNGEVILSRYNFEEGTVKLYVFNEKEATELPTD